MPRPKAKGPARATAAVPATASASTMVVDDPTIHMMKENRSKDKLLEVVTACGITGRPWTKKGEIHTSIWPGEITCPDCLALPGVSGPK